MYEQKQLNIVLLAILVSSYCQILLSKDFLTIYPDEIASKQPSQVKPLPPSFETSEQSEENETEEEKKRDSIIIEETPTKKETWREREITAADAIDLAAHTAAGAGAGALVESAVCYTIASGANTAVNTAVATGAEAVGSVAITTVAELAPTAAPAVAKAVGVATAKAITAAGAVASTPLVIGGGALIGGALGLYYGWYKWKSS